MQRTSSSLLSSSCGVGGEGPIPVFLLSPFPMLRALQRIVSEQHPRQVHSYFGSPAFSDVQRYVAFMSASPYDGKSLRYDMLQYVTGSVTMLQIIAMLSDAI